MGGSTHIHAGERLQIIERPTQTPGGRRPPWGTAGWVALGIATIPLLLFAVFNRWGVLVLVCVALTVGIAVWVWQKGLLFLELVAFLIHFDGLGAGPVRMGRIVAVIGAALLVYKFVVEKWRPPALPLRCWGPIWALSVWATLSAFWSTVASRFMLAVLVYGLGLVYYLIASTLVDTHEKLLKFLRAYWYGGMCGSVVGGSALFIGTRSVGLGADPNFFGLLEASMIPLTVYYRRNATTQTQKNWYSVALFLVLAGAAGAGSRSGLIGGSLAIVATMLTRPGLSPVRRGRVAIAAVLIAALAFGVGFFANPANLQRGFADRGAGRLDFWAVTVELIKEEPIVGHGFGQIGVLIPERLLVTPGVQELAETREGVSSHNTWLDVIGDLGVIGLGIFVSVFIVAILNLVRPRWLQMRELSTTMLIMLIPVLSGSMFLPLLNNKLAWAIIGLSAVLQVPSWRSRWSGLGGTGPGGTELARVSGGDPAHSRTVDAGLRADVVPAVLSDPEPSGVDAPMEPRYARWDLRLSRRARRTIVVGALLSGLLAGVVASLLPTHYSVTATVFNARLDSSVVRDEVFIDRERLQGVLTLAVSGAYAQQLQELSGIDLSVPEIRDRLFVTRPKQGALVRLEFDVDDKATMEAVTPHLLPALDAVIESSRAVGTEQTENEVRPIVPGESRLYLGPFYLETEQDPVVAQSAPRTMWFVVFGAVGGGLALLGLALIASRRPRVNAGDDLFEFTGLHVWTHVGGGRKRRRRATAGQLEQVAASAVDASPADTRPTRVVVASPRSDAGARRLAMGVAAAYVAQGRRVVLVDAQLSSPRLTRRLGRPGARGLGDLDRHGVVGTDVMRSVSRWRLPAEARRLVGRDASRLRFIGAGSRRARSRHELRTPWLEQFDEDVMVVVLAPPTQGAVAVSGLLGWGDATVLTMGVGRTTTADAEQAAGAVRLFVAGARGIVLVNT